MLHITYGSISCVFVPYSRRMQEMNYIRRLKRFSNTPEYFVARNTAWYCTCTYAVSFTTKPPSMVQKLGAE